jgi:hypothetical protein
MFTENLNQSTLQFKALIFTSFSNMVQIWCEVYDLLCYYVPNVACNELNFPITEIQLKSLKQMVKESKNQDCVESLVMYTFLNYQH